MTRYQSVAVRFRWILLILWILCLLAGILWMVAPLYDPDDYGVGLSGTPAIAIAGYLYHLLENQGKAGYFIVVLFYLMLFFLTQWFFLGSRRIWNPKLKEKGIPLKRVAVGAAFCVALISVGLIYSLVDLFPDFFDIFEFSHSSEPVSAGRDVLKYLFLSIPPVLWIAWSIVFAFYLRQGDHFPKMGKIVRGLIAGSLLEVFVSIPVYATRQEQCYCARGSYAGLVLGTTALLWAFGPGIFLLFLREKQRREKLLDADPAGNGGIHATG